MINAVAIHKDIIKTGNRTPKVASIDDTIVYLHQLLANNC